MTASAIRRSLLAAASLLLPAVVASPAAASWAYVPQEVRIAESSLVVVGEVAGLTDSIMKNGTQYEVGIIEPIKVLKGKPPEVIRLAWPKVVPGAPRLSTQLPTPRVGDKSIWVLTADGDQPVYWATYPTDRQPVDALKEIEKKVAAVKNLKWSKPADGLQLAVVVESRDVRNSQIRVKGELVEALATASSYTLMRNASDKPLHVVDYPYDNPFAIEFKDPAGKRIEVQTKINTPRKPPIQARNFVALAPGEVRSMGYGFQLGALQAPGEYSVQLTYKNGKTGKAQGIENVWTGETTTPPSTLVVKK